MLNMNQKRMNKETKKQTNDEEEQRIKNKDQMR